MMQPCLVDSHVHLYRQFAPSVFLDAAAYHTVRAAKSLDLPADTPGILLFTQTDGELDVPKAICESAMGWTATETNEVISTKFSTHGKPDVYVVRGWQIVGREGLEVLALGLDGPPRRQVATEEIIEEICNAGGIPVLPWGVGKWIGTRAALVRRIASNSDRFPALYFGDISGRASFIRKPEILKDLEADGHRILPGSDPLPFAQETRKVARLVFRGCFDAEHPFRSLKDWLQHEAKPLETFGQYELPLRFFKLQLMMQLRKRLQLKNRVKKIIR